MEDSLEQEPITLEERRFDPNTMKLVWQNTFEGASAKDDKFMLVTREQSGCIILILHHPTARDAAMAHISCQRANMTFISSIVGALTHKLQKNPTKTQISDSNLHHAYIIGGNDSSGFRKLLIDELKKQNKYRPRINIVHDEPQQGVRMNPIGFDVKTSSLFIPGQLPPISGQESRIARMPLTVDIAILPMPQDEKIS